MLVAASIIPVRSETALIGATTSAPDTLAGGLPAKSPAKMLSASATSDAVVSTARYSRLFVGELCVRFIVMIHAVAPSRITHFSCVYVNDFERPRDRDARRLELVVDLRVARRRRRVEQHLHVDAGFVARDQRGDHVRRREQVHRHVDGFLRRVDRVDDLLAALAVGLDDDLHGAGGWRRGVRPDARVVRRRGPVVGGRRVRRAGVVLRLRVVSGARRRRARDEQQQGKEQVTHR